MRELLNNKNFRNSQNYILGNSEKFIISDDNNKLNYLSFLAYVIISPIILLIIGFVFLFLKEIYKINIYKLDNYGALLGLIIFFIWIFIGKKIYLFLSNKKNYLLFKKNIIFDNEKYYNNFIFLKIKNKDYFRLKTSKIIGNIFSSMVLGALGFIIIYLPLILIIGIIIEFITGKMPDFLNGKIFNLIIFLICSIISFYLFINKKYEK